ncbi:MAG: nucleotidyl transferase AbiEii/AbiGii toxin family protein [Planctomycetota bacterium]
MTKRHVRNVAASVRARLLARSQTAGRPFQEVLQYYAMERFLFRLSESPHADKLVLKGGLMLTAWRAPATRPTRDIDLLARMPNDVDSVVGVVRDICVQKVDEDGLVFDVDTMQGRVIKEDADYEGVRVKFLGSLDNARVNMQIDMGFGDVVVPGVTRLEYPTILDHPPPRVRGYSQETTIAEKFEAMVTLGQINSRIRDFFDIWLLQRHFDFDGLVLAGAIRETFANRSTAVRSDPIALTPAFATDTARMRQWKGFLEDLPGSFAPATLQEAVDAIAGFIVPVARAVAASEEFTFRWTAPGPWA